jgi:hypothetical protein
MGTFASIRPLTADLSASKHGGWAAHCGDDLGHGDLGGGPSQHIAADATCPAFHDPRSRQLLKDLCSAGDRKGME